MTLNSASPFDIYTDGLKHLSGRRIEKAERCFLQNIQAALGGENIPEEDKEAAAKSWHQLGVIAFGFKNFPEALWCFKNAINLGFKSPECDQGIAISLYGLGLLEDAGKAFGELPKDGQDRDMVSAYQGRIALEKGKAVQAVGIFEKLTLGGKANAEVLVDLGLAYEALGRLQNAKGAYAEARQKAPRLFEALLQSVDQCLGLELNRTATLMLRKAEKIAPADANILYSIGLRYYTLGLQDDAIRAYRASIKISPLLASYQELASLYEKANALDQARAATRVPLQSFPDDPKTNYILALCEFRGGELAAAKTRLLRVLEMASDPAVRADILNLLGKIYDREGKPDAAYRSFQASKDALKETEDYKGLNPGKPLETLDAMSGINLAALPVSVPKIPDLEPREVVFFIGFPRSGTTLIEHVLGAHPEVQTTAEKSILMGPAAFLNKLEGGYPGSLKTLTENQAGQLRARYFYEALNFMKIEKDKVLVDKLPLNIIHLPTIRALFPDAKIILGLRHPNAACLSCLMQNFDLNNAMANLMSLDEITNFYAKTMALWQKASGEVDIACHTIRYEDVVADLEGEARKLTEFLGLDWWPKMLKYAEGAKAKGLIHTPSYAQVVQPVYTRALERWRAYEKYFEPYQNRLQPFCELFGYSK